MTDADYENMSAFSCGIDKLDNFFLFFHPMLFEVGFSFEQMRDPFVVSGLVFRDAQSQHTIKDNEF